jgi:hypothetical protein
MQVALDLKNDPRYNRLLTHTQITYKARSIRSKRQFGLKEWSDGSLRFVQNCQHAWLRMTIKVVETRPNNWIHIVQHKGENVSMYLVASNTFEGVEAYKLTSQPEGDNCRMVVLNFMPEPTASDGPSSTSATAGPSNEQLTEPTLPPPGE